jgi:hypothetical protein
MVRRRKRKAHKVSAYLTIEYYVRKAYDLLLWITNNKANTVNEPQFDIFFWSCGTVILGLGTIGFIKADEWYWASIIWIEYFWMWDAIRNNRTYIK